MSTLRFLSSKFSKLLAYHLQVINSPVAVEIRGLYILILSLKRLGPRAEAARGQGGLSPQNRIIKQKK